MDTYQPPFSIKIMDNFLEIKYFNIIENIIQKANFVPATQGSNGKQFVQEKHKIRLDYTLSNKECSFIDKPIIKKSDCGCTLRERWRLLYYNGDCEKKAFRDSHTDWTSHSCHRRISIIIGLTDSSEYEGGELVFKNNNLKYKINKFSAVIFDSKLLHEVLPVTQGKRYVLQAFLFDESGWNIKKIQNDKNSFKLLDCDENLSNCLENWKIEENKNAIHSKLKNPESHFIGNFNNLNDLLYVLNNNNKKFDFFTWHTNNLPNKKWASKAFGFTTNDMIIKNRIDLNTWINERNVISGYKININSYLSIISTDGGPGNQIVGVKEGLLMSKYLKREFLFPPIIQHYVLNQKNRGNRNLIKYWNFDEIFAIKNNNINNLLTYTDLIKEVKNCYYVRNNDIDNPLRCEKLINFNNTINKINLPQKIFKKHDDFDILKYINDKLFLITHLYNNIYISNCGWNGCDSCDLNPIFLKDYGDICSTIDFSNVIKDFGNEYIKETFNNEEYISLHLRFPDYGSIKINYQEDDIEKLIQKVCKTNNILEENVFIATSNQNFINKSCLKKYKMLIKNEKYNELESFIEQYICSNSKIFIYNGGIQAKSEHKHLRSTWASFVIDYRIFLLNKNKSTNIYLSKYFNNIK